MAHIDRETVSNPQDIVADIRTPLKSDPVIELSMSLFIFIIFSNNIDSATVGLMVSLSCFSNVLQTQRSWLKSVRILNFSKLTESAD